MNHRLYGVRGAVCCENTIESLSLNVPELYTQLLKQNNIGQDDIVSILFSVTDDLTALNPATALRNAGLAPDLPLFACAEPFIEGYLPHVIRILVTYYGNKKPSPLYINGAERLRPDLEAEHETPRTTE
jgi:chorismate mutase